MQTPPRQQPPLPSRQPQSTTPSSTASPSTMGTPTKRREIDLTKLAMRDFEIHGTNSVGEFWVTFVGPKDTPYENGVWNVHVELSDRYPYKSPSLGFANRIFHPNVDEASGTICLDVINQTWTPMYDLYNVFETFLPQLLRYPNPTDPLNGEAAAMLLQTPDKYAARVREHTAMHATRERAMEAIGVLPVGVMPPSTSPDDPKRHSGVGDVNGNGNNNNKSLSPSRVVDADSDSDLEELEL
eukprot:PhM_4_TR14857/c0_g1_i1/m.26130/K10576/UBE2H, UBC8; ubiquitin-conjugating enzyme E2 H